MKTPRDGLWAGWFSFIEDRFYLRTPPDLGGARRVPTIWEW